MIGFMPFQIPVYFILFIFVFCLYLYFVTVCISVIRMRYTSKSFLTCSIPNLIQSKYTMSEKNEKSESVIKRKVKKKRNISKISNTKKWMKVILPAVLHASHRHLSFYSWIKKKKIEKDVLIIIPKLCTQNLKPS